MADSSQSKTLQVGSIDPILHAAFQAGFPRRPGSAEQSPLGAPLARSGKTLKAPAPYISSGLALLFIISRYFETLV